MSTEPLSTEAVKKIGHLCRLHIPEENICKCRDQISVILEYFRQIQELDIQGIEPLYHPTEMFSPLAEDIVGISLSAKQVLQNAPSTEGEFISVPGVYNKGLLPVKPVKYKQFDKQ